VSTQRSTSSALVCSCGYRILCELRQEGERLGLPVFFDDQPASETRGQQVRSCAGCGQSLGLHMLQAR
jgi:hypothetical protein